MGLAWTARIGGDEFSDAYYLDGCSVGGLARLYLASHYKRGGDDREAEKLIEEIEGDYEDAQDDSGRPIIEMAQALRTAEFAFEVGLLGERLRGSEMGRKGVDTM